MDMDLSWADNLDLPDICTGYAYDSAAHNIADVDDLLSGYLQDDGAWWESVPIPVEAGNQMGEAALSESVPIPVEAANQMGEAALYESVHVPLEPDNQMVEAGEEGTRGAEAMGTEADGGGTRSGEGWWDTVYSSEEHFRHQFRMSRSTFAFVCSEVADVICKDAEACPATFIPVPERVAICLWRLVHGESLSTVAKRFIHARATCHRIFHDVCAAIKAKVVGKEVRWPDAAAMAANAAKFQALSGIQGTIGAVYTTRFLITAPKHNPTDYYSRGATPRNRSKPPCSITLQASVNADGTFTEVFAGHPGGMSDEETLLAWTRTKPELTGQILGESMRLVGGAGYPLTEWMMVPYAHQNLTPAQQSFNEAVKKVLAVGVETFRRFKARWSFLQKRIEIKLKGEKENEAEVDVDLAVVLEVCCALHNICERLGDPLDLELLQGVELNDDGGMVVDEYPSPSASDLRDTLADDLVIMGAV